MPNNHDPRVPIRSTWRTEGYGKKLTDAIIRRYEKLGYYGQVAESKHIVHRCQHGECTSKKQVVYYKYKYLPKPGFYCLQCFVALKKAHHQEQEEKARWAELRLAEYV